MSYILSYPILSYSIILSYPSLCPVLAYPILSYSILSSSYPHPILSYPYPIFILP